MTGSRNAAAFVPGALLFVTRYNKAAFRSGNIVIVPPGGAHWPDPSGFTSRSEEILFPFVKTLWEPRKERVLTKN